MATNYNFSALAVLVADKNAHMRRLVRGILRELNIRMVIEAPSPEEALDLLVTKPFDLAFIEWAPDFDGNATVRRLRREARAMSRYIPVIVTSAYTEVQHVVTSRDNGATQFLAKPFTAKLIFSHLQAVVEGGHRLFVQSKVYVGPDRRRKKRPPPDGTERRGAKSKAAAPESETAESKKDTPAKE